ncbi:NADPH:quinone reductase [Acetobacter aceti NRIC 0242]|uniref:Uncharacterized protein n=2 Tax=Acetobacter aceti TaxID=435 RepID=A0A6S6PEC2_ACEAC|nr:hypothetical protein AAJCM20276_02170 [Acetobacter aceti]BCK76416.1 hypothetical protein EMQ_2022 [Acetobacter aceti NBRC 14818]GAN56158.1 hypothetical protein Abac_003_057 [Acetobacter aceti NBRC 14818]GBO81933.1 NADPH:quinone reductase [Acetobacter aceti NRIC 0242]
MHVRQMGKALTLAYMTDHHTIAPASFSPPYPAIDFHPDWIGMMGLHFFRGAHTGMFLECI